MLLMLRGLLWKKTTTHTQENIDMCFGKNRLHHMMFLEQQTDDEFVGRKRFFVDTCIGISH